MKSSVAVAVDDLSLPAPSAPVTDASEGRVSIGLFAGYLLVSVVIALMLSRWPEAAAVHAILTFAVGLWAVAQKRLDRVVKVCLYIVGCEVLWRMADANIGWEAGKLAIAGLMGLALVRTGRLRAPVLIVLYFALLLPSTHLTITGLDWHEARSQLSFNLSGHLALAVAAWFFGQVTIGRTELTRMLLVAVGPLAGIAAIGLAAVLQTSDITFNLSSNHTTSAGYGPNQVAAAAALCTLLTFLLAVTGRLTTLFRVGLLVVAIGCGVASGMTFSRGGLYTATGAVLVALTVLFRDARTRLRVVPALAVIVLLSNYFLVPYLDRFTGGMLVTRFHDVDVTGRDRMVQADLDLWGENLAWGVGPGLSLEYRAQHAYRMSPYYVPRDVLAERIAAHTEFSRVLAEHGTFGLCSLLALAVALIRTLRRPAPVQMKAVVVSLAAWSLLFMSINAMRLAAPSLLLAMAFARYVDDGELQIPDEIAS